MTQIVLDNTQKLDTFFPITKHSQASIPEIGERVYQIWKGDDNVRMSVRQILGKFEHSEVKNFIRGKFVSLKMTLVIDEVEEKSMRFTPTVFETPCPNCGDEGCKTRMCVTTIPFFEEIILMTTECEKCGLKDSEMKGLSGGIKPHGVKTTLSVQSEADMSREILKSEFARVTVPSIELTIEPGTQGSRLTTIEGLLAGVYDSLKNQMVIDERDANDSPPENVQQIELFLEKLKDIIDGRFDSFDIVIDDPSGGSYLQNFYAPDPDPMMSIETYIRTKEQDEELGMSDEDIAMMESAENDAV